MERCVSFTIRTECKTRKDRVREQLGAPMYGAIADQTARYSYDVLDNLTRVTAPGRDHYYCYRKLPRQAQSSEGKTELVGRISEA